MAAASVRLQHLGVVTAAGICELWKRPLPLALIVTSVVTTDGQGVR